MKRLLVALVLAMMVLAVAASPAFAYLSAQAGGPVVSASPAGAPVMASHAAVLAHQRSVGVITAGGGTAQATRILARGVPGGTLPASHGGTGILIALLLAVVIGGAVYAIVADRRGHAPARSAKPARLPDFKPATDQKRKAA